MTAVVSKTTEVTGTGDVLTIAGHDYRSRLLVGTGK